ncbi:MAG: sugar phosphate nucleotidyltransferase [Nanoarchaeota archaeon]
MKGIILAGGKATRLYPITKFINKHLLPVYDKPMIYYPLQTLISMGIKEICIVSNREGVPAIIQYLGSGEEFGVDISYKIQEEAGGISHALKLTKNFAHKEPITVILGDNIFIEKIKMPDFREGAHIFLKEVNDPKRFGVAVIQRDKVKEIVEKPEYPKSNLAIVGLYIYDKDVFNKIENLKPSARGELEITDLNLEYLKENKLTHSIVQGAWLDAGTFDSLVESSKHIMDIQK